jgi:hypothetical protein
MKITKIPKVAYGLFTTAVLLLATAAQADIPSLISYQGKLTDAQGVPVADGTYTFNVMLGTEDGSTVIFDSGDVDVDVAGGLYSLDIGPVTDLAGLAENAIFLHLKVGDETFPPIALKSVPYALLAGQASSVADGSITESSLSENLATNIAMIPDLSTGVDEIASQIAVSGDKTIGQLVNSFRGVTQPVWTSKQHYIIARGVAFSKTNAFAFAGPSLMNPQTGAPANRPAITVIGTLPPGLTYTPNSDTLASGVDGPTTLGVYPLTLQATDMLGQTVTQDVTIEVIELYMGLVSGAITNTTALNMGVLPDGADGLVLAGDTVALTQDMTGDVDKVVGFPFLWDVPPLVSAADVAGSQTLSFTAMRFTTGLPGMPTTNHEGLYQPRLILDFGQTIWGDTFEVGAIDPGFSLNHITYDGGVPLPTYTVTAGSNSEALGVTANLFPGFNGVAHFQWYVGRDNLGSADTVMAIPGAVYQNFVLQSAVQILDKDGLALQNGVVSTLPGFGQDFSFYFPAVNNGYADLASTPDWYSQDTYSDATPNTANIQLQVNDNINVADKPDDKTEYDGYPVSMGVVAGTTNSVGTLSHSWFTIDVYGDQVLGTQSASGNSYTLAGADMNSNKDPYTVTDTITSSTATEDLAEEQTSAEVDLLTAILPAENDTTILIDTTNDVMGDPVINDGGSDAFFGIYSPNDDNDPMTETVDENENVTFQIIVWIPKAMLSSNDDGEFHDFATPPDRVLSVVWKLDPAAGGDVITIPESNVSDPEYVEYDPSGLDRVGVRWQMTIVNAQDNNNNKASGDYWAEVSSPTGTYYSPDVTLVVVPD